MHSEMTPSFAHWPGCSLCIPTKMKPTGFVPPSWLATGHIPTWEKVTLDRMRPSRHAVIGAPETITASLESTSKLNKQEHSNSFSEDEEEEEEEEEDVLSQHEDIGKVDDWVAEVVGPLYGEKSTVEFGLDGWIWSDPKDSEGFRSILLFFIPQHDPNSLLRYLIDSSLYSNPSAPSPAGTCAPSVLIKTPPCSTDPYTYLPQFPPEAWDFRPSTISRIQFQRRVKNMVALAKPRGNGRDATPFGERIDHSGVVEVKPREKAEKSEYRCFNGNSE